MGVTAPRVSQTDRLVGQRMRVRRQELRLSQKDIAEMLGVTFQQVQKYEAGENRISAGRLETLSSRLGVPLSYFFSSEGDGRSADATDASHPALKEPGAMALLNAYAAIQDSEARKAVINFARKQARAAAAAE